MNEKLRALIEKMTVLTETNKLHWEKTVRDTEFFAPVGSGRVTVDRWNTDEGTELVDVCLYNEAGERIEYCATPPDDSLEYRLINALHEAARRQILDIDGTIESMMADLDRLMRG